MSYKWKDDGRIQISAWGVEKPVFEVCKDCGESMEPEAPHLCAGPPRPVDAKKRPQP